MKRIKLFLIGMLSLFMLPSIVNASSGSINITGSSTVIVGNRVTLTVTLSSGSAIGSWEMQLNYDKAYLQLVSSTAEAGGTYMVNSSSGTKSKSYTFTFKALKRGSTRVSISSYDVYDYNTIENMNITANAKTIRIMTQQELEATYSKDNNLKSLSVEGYELDKEFSKDTLEYTIQVPTGTTSVKIKATKNDSKASVSGAGEVTVTEGLNTIPIVVTAQNGDEKTYTLIVNVEDQNPINVTINNKNYTVVKNAAILPQIDLFEATTVTINGYEIPSYYNAATGYTLVGLKDSDGNVSLFLYSNNTYTAYNELNITNLKLIPLKFNEELEYIKTTITINNQEFEAYKYEENSDYVIIHAMNLETGKKDLYLYDTALHNAIKFDRNIFNSLNETIKNYTYIIIGFAGALFLMLIAILSLIHSSKKKQKKINKFIEKQEAKIEATRKLNDVIDEVAKITNAEKEVLEKKNNKKKKKQEEVKVEKIELEPKEETEKVESKEMPKEEKKEDDQAEEMYDLFADDKKRKKKK